jgi:hypothetical protein
MECDSDLSQSSLAQNEHAEVANHPFIAVLTHRQVQDFASRW